MSDFMGEADDRFPLMVLLGAGGAGSGRDWIPVASFQFRVGREVRRDCGLSLRTPQNENLASGAGSAPHLITP